VAWLTFDRDDEFLHTCRRRRVRAEDWRDDPGKDGFAPSSAGEVIFVTDGYINDSAQCRRSIEPHYTVSEIAEMWKLSVDTVRRMFGDEPGVLKIGQATRLVKRKYVRHHFVLRIPESVLLRVQDRLMHKRGAESDTAASLPVAGRRRDLHAS
jgi:hypothetical protein